MNDDDGRPGEPLLGSGRNGSS